MFKSIKNENKTINFWEIIWVYIIYIVHPWYAVYILYTVHTWYALLIHKSNERLLYLALYWQSHNYIGTGHLILAINTWIVHQRCIVLFLCIQQMNGCEPPISEHRNSIVGDSNSVVGLVYISQQKCSMFIINFWFVQLVIPTPIQGVLTLKRSNFSNSILQEHLLLNQKNSSTECMRRNDIERACFLDYL